MGPLETEEFDPTVYPAEYVTVGVEEEIQSILERVEEAWTRTPNAVLVIPRGAQAFHTTHDFLALGKLQGGRDVRVSIASLDPTIAGLARVLGFHMVEPPAGHPVLVDDPSTGEVSGEESEGEKPTSPLPLMGYGERPDWVFSPTTPTYAPSSLTTSAWLNNPGDPALYESGRLSPVAVAAQPSARSGVPPPRTRPRQTGQLSPALVSEASLTAEEVARPHVSPTPSGRIKARTVLVPADGYQNAKGLRYSTGMSRPLRWRRVFAVLLALVLVSALSGAAYAYVYLPEGRVAVTPGQTTIDDLRVEIAVLTASNDGGGEAEVLSPSRQVDAGSVVQGPSVTGTLVQAQIVEEGSRPSTGTRQVPRGRGQGIVRFTNRTSNAIPVPAGLQIKAANGVAVQTTQGGTVQPTVFGVSFGTLDLPVAATVEGPSGNLAAGQLSGVYNGQLNYYNNAALQGGALETIKVVTQEDIDALAADLRARAESRMGSAIVEKVAAEQQLITQTIVLTNTSFVADRKAGEDAESVGVKLTAEAGAYVFEERSLQGAVTQALQDYVEANIPTTAGPTLDMSSIRYVPPTLKAVEQGRVVYSTAASARVTFSLTPDLANGIRALVKGKEIGQARTLIAERYGDYVSPTAIQARVLWMEVGKLPDDPARIVVEASATTGRNGLPPNAGGPDDRTSRP